MLPRIHQTKEETLFTMKIKTRSRRMAPFIALLAGLALVTLSACGSESAATPSPTVVGGSSTPQTGAQEVRVVAKDNLFDPKSYTLEVGKTYKLTVVNEGLDVHEVDIQDVFPETKLSPGQSKSIDLQQLKPGTYKLYCEIHEDDGMVGEFIVK